jgi:hypothetical protein
MNQRLLLPALAALASAALLAGCGGGDGNSVSPPAAQGSDVPQSALASPQAYTSFVGSLKTSDASAPLALGDISPPTSETLSAAAVQ